MSRSMTSAQTIPLFDVGHALGRALWGRHDRTSPDHAWGTLLDQAIEISDHDPDVVATSQEIRIAVDDLVSPAATHLYAEWARQNVTTDAAKALLDGISCAVLG